MKALKLPIRNALLTITTIMPQKIAVVHWVPIVHKVCVLTSLNQMKKTFALSQKDGKRNKYHMKYERVLINV